MSKQDDLDAALQSFEENLPQRYDAAVELSTLQVFPGNPKQHDIGAIIASIERNGMSDVIKVQEGTRLILGGHGTCQALQQMGWTHAPVLWIDCDARTARRLVLAYNRTTELGGFDQLALVEFLTPVGDADDLLGTGYDGDDLDALHYAVHFAQREDAGKGIDANAEWQGMPEFTQEDQRAWKNLIVNFTCVEDYNTFAQLIKQSLTPKTRSVWFPYVAPADLKALTYATREPGEESEAGSLALLDDDA